MNAICRLLSASAAISLATTLAIPARAQDKTAVTEEVAVVDEITVTAQKRESSILDVPAPLAVLTGERIQKRTISDFEGLIENVPGISIVSDYGGSGSKVISIRGIGGTDDYRPNGNSSVALHVDNIYQASNVFLAMPFFDVERVEILKGPQGTLYGRNSTAGVVNLVTRSGTSSFGGYSSAQYESHDRARLEGAVGAPIADRISLRIAGVVDQGGGYFDGRGAGPLAGRTYFPVVGPVPDPGRREGFGDRDLFAGRATLDMDLSPDSKFVVKLYGSSDKGEPQQPDTPGGVTNAGFIEPDDNPYTFFSSFYPEKDVGIWGLSGSFQQKLSDNLAVDLIAGYQSADRSMGGTGFASPRRNFSFLFQDNIDQHSVEARLSSRGNAVVEWVVGGYYLHDKVDFRTDILAGDVFATNLVSDYHQRRTSTAAFGQVDVHFAPRLTLSGGLRYTEEDARFFGLTRDANPFGASISPFALPVVFDNDFDDDDVSGRATLSFRPTDSTNFYVSVGKGYKAGGFDGSTILSVAEALPFKSENLWAYEGGFKLAGPRGLFVNVDGFYYDFENLQASTTVLVGGTASANVRTNVAEARLYGIDIAAGMTLVQSGPHRLAIDGGVTLLDSKILEYRSANPALVAINLDNALPAAPEFSGNAEARYTYSSGRGWQATASIDARRKSSEFKRLDNNNTSFVEDYTLLNARVELNLENHGLTLFGYARNITDEIYYLDRNTTSRLVGSPRIFGAGARLDF